MTKRLRNAIEKIINDSFDKEDVKELSTAYSEHREARTLTMSRVEFLEDCLESGMNKRAAARALVKHDPNIGKGTAETLVYTAFSGQYQNPRRKRRTNAEIGSVPVEKIDPPAISSEEDLL